MRLRKGTTQPGSYVSHTRRCMRESTLVNAGSGEMDATEPEGLKVEMGVQVSILTFRLVPRGWEGGAGDPTG